nr:glutathione S-transferase family protein [uncultured Duganella sp.]
MRLYHHAISSNSRRVMLAALHMGTPLELSEVSLMDPDDRRRLAELNPNCKLPVLQDGEFTLWESCAIMQYLADRTLGQTLYPDNIATRADINRWMLWACQHWSSAISLYTFENIWKGRIGQGGPDAGVIARAEVQIAQFAKVLDDHLSTRQWLVGDKLSLADFAVAPGLMYTEQARLPVTGYRHIMAWYDRVRDLEVWSKTEPKG